MAISALSHIKKLRKDLTWSEISGAFGDLGTFLPLLIGLTKSIGLDLGTTLIASGIYNVVSGWAFDLPIPVQPMKTIAAVAIDKKLSISEVCAAGIFVSAAIFFLGITRFINVFNLLIPTEVIRGIQVAVGLRLAITGFSYSLFDNGKYDTKKSLAQNTLPFTGTECLLTSILVLTFCLFTVDWDRKSACCVVLEGKDAATALGDAAAAPGQTSGGAADDRMSDKGYSASVKGSGSASDSDSGPSGYTAAQAGQPGHACHAPSDADPSLKALDLESSGVPASGGVGQAVIQPSRAALRLASLWRWMRGAHVPSALVALAVGVIMSLVNNPDAIKKLKVGPSTPKLIDYHDTKTWRTGILRMGIPQLPLTALNSVVAVVAIAAELFPAHPLTASYVASSVGMMNLVGCWLGAMPCCHGSGGLAAQVRFGALTGAAPIFLGLLKIFFGALFGSSLYQLLRTFPNTVMGPLLIISGLELAGTAQFETTRRGTLSMLLTTACALSANDVSVGFAAGLMCAYVLKLRAEGWRPLARLWTDAARQLAREYRSVGSEWRFVRPTTWRLYGSMHVRRARGAESR